MEIVKKVEEGRMTLGIQGRLDTITSTQFQEELMQAVEESDHVLLDFAGLVYISSAGLRVLLMAQKGMGAKGGSLTLTHVCDEIMEVFEMTGFTEILTIEES